MKRFYLTIVSSCLAAQAFGKGLSIAHNSPLRQKNVAGASPLFRDPTITRGGAIPGLQAYSDALDKNPITMKARTSLIGWFLGDLLAQVFIAGGPVDWKRLATLSFFGFAYHGPSGHYFYNWLDEKIPGTDSIPVYSKVAIDQLFWCPIFMSVFFTYLGLVNGDSLATIGTRIKNNLLAACQGSWKVWPLVHLINFKFVSNKWRIPYINAMQIAFNSPKIIALMMVTVGLVSIHGGDTDNDEEDGSTSEPDRSSPRVASSKRNRKVKGEPE